MATSKKYAGKIADNIGYPVVMKVMSNDIIHKFDVKGVVLNVNSREEAEETFARIISNVNKRIPSDNLNTVLL